MNPARPAPRTFGRAAPVRSRRCPEEGADPSQSPRGDQKERTGDGVGTRGPKTRTGKPKERQNKVVSNKTDKPSRSRSTPPGVARSTKRSSASHKIHAHDERNEAHGVTWSVIETRNFQDRSTGSWSRSWRRRVDGDQQGNPDSASPTTPAPVNSLCIRVKGGSHHWYGSIGDVITRDRQASRPTGATSRRAGRPGDRPDQEGDLAARTAPIAFDENAAVLIDAQNNRAVPASPDRSPANCVTRDFMKISLAPEVL